MGLDDAGVATELILPHLTGSNGRRRHRGRGGGEERGDGGTRGGSKEKEKGEVGGGEA